ncbi:aspartyl protease [Chamaesiphon sp. VAR_48_metabat_403]|uniref:aspartyl protease n=1 Tax=Chamaesiphon sp. VAR_48_metabat_403 TaxID=2964700 RepID=UPI00286E2E01|nr:aspartyl protease [Chamaesiphon sp. VAR_48_metabat_403]
MILGSIGNEDAILFEIDLIAANGLKLPVDAMFDTGFSYWLAINEQDIEGLGWERLRAQTMQTERGEIEFDIYIGKVEFDGEELDIPVHVGTELTEVLLGRKWLIDRKLIIDLPSNTLTFGN